MECPYCECELKYVDYYGKRKYAEHYYQHPQSWIDKAGDILKCPNCEGFDDVEDAKKYRELLGSTDDTPPEYMACESGIHNGYFYTDRQGNLHNGYPC